MVADPHHLARLAAPAKHYLADPALAARLLGADVDALLDAVPVGPPTPRNGPLLGHLVVERADHRVLAIEVKLGAVVDLRWLRGALGPDLLDAVVVTTGTEAYRREDGIAVVPAALLGP